MVERIINFLSQVELTNIFGILLYWVPLSFCVIGYTVRTFRNVQKDKEQLAKYLANNSHYYNPTDTIGTLIGRAFVCFIPVANLWAALFDIAPTFFGNFFKWLGDVFDIPLVPKKKRDGEI